MKTFKKCIFFTIIILIITLFFGLKPKGFHLSNSVTTIEGQPGLRFGDYGIAYIKLDKDQLERDISDTDGFTIEMAIRPESLDQNGFNHILSIHGEEDRDQFLIGQWRSYIIVMNGDDYANKRKTKRITYKIATTIPEMLFLSITTGERGTDLYINGQHTKSKDDLMLKFPKGDQLILTLGNSVYGKHSWKGDIYGVALYGDVISPKKIKHHSERLLNEKKFSFEYEEKPLLAYTFDKIEGEVIQDQVKGKNNLKIPVRMQVLEKRMLSMQWSDLEMNRNFILDFIINLIGFIPLGFFLAATFVSFEGPFQRKTILITVFFCFLISLGIEVVQAWIPSRSSQSLDLILNTLGGLFGGLIFKKYISPPAPLETLNT